MSNNTRKNTSDEPLMPTMPSWQSISIGVVFTALMILMFHPLYWFFIGLVFGRPDGTIEYLLVWRLLALFIEVVGLSLYFFWGGIVNVPVPYRGQILFFGKRLENFPLLEEGYGWTLPRPFMFVEPISLEKRVETSMKVEVNAKGTPISLEVTLEWVVWDTYQYLSIGAEAVDRGLKAMVKSILRSFCAKQTPEKLVNFKAEDFAGPLEDLGDAVTKEDWGIDVIRVLVERVSLPAKLQEAYADVLVEDQQREAEEKNTKTLAANIALLVAAGLTPEIASNTVLAVQGHQTRREIVVSGLPANSGAGGPIAAALLAGIEALNQRNDDKKDKKGKGAKKKGK